MSTRAFIALGSNLSDPIAQIEAAVQALSELPDSGLVKRSPLYRNRALGPGRQPDFINAVVELATDLDPFALLAAIQKIEKAHGRERRAGRWMPRTIDLDILLYGDLCVVDERLTLPHSQMHQRRFVLQPLSDIAPDLELPGYGSLSDLLRRAPPHELKKVTTTATAAVVE